jgi:hypothetical protein
VFHPDCIHRYDEGWSCSRLTDYASAFHESATNLALNLTCSFCGKSFLAVSNILIEHLNSKHQFAECYSLTTFTKEILFISRHGVKTGRRTKKLTDACYYQIYTLPQIRLYLSGLIVPCCPQLLRIWTQIAIKKMPAMTRDTPGYSETTIVWKKQWPSTFSMHLSD